LKETLSEKQRLIKKLAERESVALAQRPETVEEVKGVKIVVRDFRDVVDIDRMVQTADEMIRRDQTIVTIFYGTEGKNAQIVVMTGELALKKGVDARQIVQEASAIINGGGGGKPNFAQGGGTAAEKLGEAVEKAEEVLKEQLNH
jgi:alanyl-tRNA synthetase